MTRHPKDIVHLGLRDWCLIAGIAIPLVASWVQLSIAFARVEATQTHILDRLERMEDRGQ